jgi:invasion protein IalB
LALCLTPARAGDAFSSPAIDPSLFKPEAIRRIEGEVGAWRYVCDEVIPLKRRICSLNTFLYDENGGAVGAFVVSTDERGRPAALVRLRPPLAISQGLQLRASYEVKNGAKRRTVAYADKIAVKLCDDKICTAFLYLRDEAVYALSIMQNIRIDYVSAQSGLASWRPGFESMYVKKTAYVKGDGFSQALERSGK